MSEPSREDPQDLPLFSSSALPRLVPVQTGRPGGGVRPGRVRSAFRMVESTATPATGAGAVRPGPVGVDWALVAALRSQVSELLTKTLGDDRSKLDRPAQEELGRSLIVEILEAAAATAVSSGKPAWSTGEQDALAVAVFNAVFRMGRLQPLVEDDRVENIVITGADRVWLETVDGQVQPGPPVAESNQELIDFLAFLASRSETSPRPFSEAQPMLHLRLEDGSRLAATGWLTSRPSVVIRRHRLRSVSLEDLVGLGTLTPVAASFLQAAVEARLSIVVAGPQGSGKTTMLRGLCSAIDRWEAIATFETEYELFLDEMPDQHAIVHAFEERPGSGEVGPDGRPAGAYSMASELIDSFRLNVGRQIVGEVRGPEAWSLIKAAESTSGSLSTTHAANAEAAIRKLITCAMEAGPHVTQDLATSKLAESIDLVVQMHLHTVRHRDGTSRRRRWVSEIVAITPGERQKGYAITHVFRPAAGRAAVANVLPDELRGLADHGFDVAGFLREAREMGER